MRSGQWCFLLDQLGSNGRKSMKPSILRSLRASAMYRALSSSPASAQALEALAARSWRVAKVARDSNNYKDCCGSSTSQGDTTITGKQSELLSKDYKFRNFKEAWRFMSQVADAAERLKVTA